MKKLLIRLGIFALIVVIPLGGWFWFKEQRVVRIETNTVDQQNLTQQVIAPGELEPWEEQVVFAPLSGTIDRVSVANQDWVEKDKELFSYDLMPLLTARDQANAALESAQANLEKVNNAPLSSDAEKKAAQAAVTAAKQVLLQARINLGKHIVKAPVEGRVFFSHVSPISGSFELRPGTAVQAGQELMRIKSTREGFVFKAQVGEAEISQIDVGQRAIVTLDAYPGKTFEGSVAYVSASRELSATGESVFTVKIQLTGFPQDTQLGLSGDAQIVVAQPVSALVVPFEAVKFVEDQAVVFVVQGERVQRREVELGQEVDGVYEVLHGLSAGERVAVSNLDRLADGRRIQAK